MEALRKVLIFASFVTTAIDAAAPGNDNYCDATDVGTLTGPPGSGVTFPFTNVDATAEPGEPSPGAGTGPSSCNSQDGWCSFEVDVQKSVWYTFDVSDVNCVDIIWDDTSTPDLQFALYEVTGLCSAVPTFLEVAANDDSGPVFTPLIEGATVAPGKLYALQVDGFNGAEGEGSIKIQDCSPDTDGDGVVNFNDECPNSDVGEEFNINYCIPGVTPLLPDGDVVFDNGCTPSQELARRCLKNFKNPADKTVKGKVQSCVAAVMNEWVADEIILPNEKGRIQKCVRNVCVTTCGADDAV